jgi:anti-sigma regulatory factor (Ser/Thr protein kinase)
MSEENPNIFRIKIPSDVDYIPPIRKYISEILQIKQFGPKFAFRSEVIVDEICYNAVIYGSRSVDATVDLMCELYRDRVEFKISDQGGSKKDLQRLKVVMERKDSAGAQGEPDNKKGLGLDIVRMLSSEVDMKIDENNVTSIHVVRKREDN